MATNNTQPMMQAADTIVKAIDRLKKSINNYTLGEAAVMGVANDLETEDEGKVLDARQGKVLADQISGIEDQIGEVPSGETVEGQIGSLSDRIAKKVGYDIVDVYTGNVLEASAGLYRCPSTAPNLPIASNGYLTVITRSTNLTLLQYVADNGRMFINARNSSSWTGWQELALNSDVEEIENQIGTVPSGETVEGQIGALSALADVKPNFVNVPLVVSDTTTYTFTKDTRFILITTRAKTTLSGTFGLFIGAASSNGSAVKAVLTPASGGITVSITDRTISATCNTDNIAMTIIYI
jgi:hypothetical protein